MKRYISLVLAAVVLICSLAVPSYAAEYDNVSYLNVMEFVDIDQYSLAVGQTEVTIPLPIRSLYYSVDILLSWFTPSANVPPSNVYIKRGNSLIPLSFVAVSFDTYRIFGDFERINLDSITLVFDVSVASQVYFRSFFVNYFKTSIFDSTISGNITWNGEDRPISIGSGISFTATWPSESSLYLRPSDWNKYDYLDVSLYMDVYSISSVAVDFGGIKVPFSISHITSEGSTANNFYFVIRIDLRGLDRASTSIPEIIIEFDSHTEYLNQVSILNCIGIIDADTINPLPYFFGQLFDKLGSWFSSLNASVDSWGQQIVDSLTGDSSAADQFKDQIDQSNQDLADMSSVMNSFTTPDINSINVDVGSFVSPSDISSLTAPMSLLFESNIVITCIMISIILATVMFVLYGKR